MVSIRVQVTTVEARVSVVLIESLSLPEVDPWVVLPQPVAVLHPTLPGHVHQLGVTATFLRLSLEIIGVLMVAGRTDLRLDKPPFLSAASAARLEEIGRVDGNSALGVKEGCKMVPGAQSWHLPELDKALAKTLASPSSPCACTCTCYRSAGRDGPHRGWNSPTLAPSLCRSISGILADPGKKTHPRCS